MNLSDLHLFERFGNSRAWRLVWTLGVAVPAAVAQLLWFWRWMPSQLLPLAFIAVMGVGVAALLLFVSYWVEAKLQARGRDTHFTVSLKYAWLGVLLALPAVGLLAALVWFTAPVIVRKLKAPSNAMLVGYAAVATVLVLAPLVSESVPSLVWLLFPASVAALFAYTNLSGRKGSSSMNLERVQ